MSCRSAADLDDLVLAAFRELNVERVLAARDHLPQTHVRPVVGINRDDAPGEIASRRDLVLADPDRHQHERMSEWSENAFRCSANFSCVSGGR